MKQNTPKNSGKVPPPGIAAMLAQGARPPARPMGPPGLPPVPPPGLPPRMAQGGPPPAMNPLMAGHVGPPIAPGGIDPALLAKLFGR